MNTRLIKERHDALLRRFHREKKRGSRLDLLIRFSHEKIYSLTREEKRTQRIDFNQKRKGPGLCFVCKKQATCKHHVIQIQFGGSNSNRNVVKLCAECHDKIHPWIATKRQHDALDQEFFQRVLNG